jgi:aspartyl protease family protein
MDQSQDGGGTWDPFALSLSTHPAHAEAAAKATAPEPVSLPAASGLAHTSESRKELLKDVSFRSYDQNEHKKFRFSSVRMKVLLALLVLAGSGWVLAAGFDADRLIGIEARELLIATALLGTLALIVGYALGDRSTQTLRAARDFMAGLVLAVAIMTTYNFRYEILTAVHQATGAYANPTTSARAETDQDSERAVRIRRRPDGHFIARADVNGTAMPMLVDTGASTVVLKPADAQKLGIDPEKLRYTVPVQTANGTTYAASVKIKGLSVGPIWIGEVEALVSKPGTLKDSLLGMTFLNRLRSYEFSGDFLTLRI